MTLSDDPQFVDEVSCATGLTPDVVLDSLDVLSRLDLVEQTDPLNERAPWRRCDETRQCNNGVRRDLLNRLRSERRGSWWVTFPEFLEATGTDPRVVGVCLWCLERDGLVDRLDSTDTSYAQDDILGHLVSEPSLPAWRAVVPAIAWAPAFSMDVGKQLYLFGEKATKCEYSGVFEALTECAIGLVSDDVVGIRGDGHLVLREGSLPEVVGLPPWTPRYDGECAAGALLAMMRVLYKETFSVEEAAAIATLDLWMAHGVSLDGVRDLLDDLEWSGAVERVGDDRWRAVVSDRRVVLTENRRRIYSSLTQEDVEELSRRFDGREPVPSVVVTDAVVRTPVPQVVAIVVPVLSPTPLVEHKPKRSHKAKKIDWDAQPLGQMPDTHLAKKLRVSGQSVQKARVDRGIPMYQTDGPRPRSENAGIDWDAQPLGKVLDRVLAKQLGVGHQAVGIARRRRGIPPLLGRAGRPKNGLATNTVEVEGESESWASSVQRYAHEHKCPVCFKHAMCFDPGCKVDGDFAGYRTCVDCLSRLEKEPGTRGAPYIAVGLAR